MLVLRISIFTICFLSLAHSQNLKLEWVGQIGGSELDASTCVDLDANSNIYMGGTFKDTVDFDPDSKNTLNLVSQGGRDVFLIKLNSGGEMVWTKILRSFGNVDLNDVHIDQNGDVLLVGQFQGTIDLDPGSSALYRSAVGTNDMFVVKLDSDGNFVWGFSIGGSFGIYGSSITTNSNRAIFITGGFQDSVDFDPGIGTYNLVSNGAYDIFVLRLTPTGSLTWAYSFGATNLDAGIIIKNQGMDRVYIAGYFTDTVDFNSGIGIDTLSTNSNAQSDPFVLLVDGSGQFKWVVSYGVGANQSADCRDMIIDMDGHILLTGSYPRTVDFDPGPNVFSVTSINNSSDNYVLKLDTNGAFIWVKSFGGPSFDNSNAIGIDDSSNIYTCGIYEGGNVDFDPDTSSFNLNSAGVRDGFIHKLDSSGKFKAVYAISGMSFENCKDLRIDSALNIYTVGSFYATTDFNPGPTVLNKTSRGNYDSFVHKLSKCGEISGIDEVTACDSYAWVDGNTYTADNDSAKYTSPNRNGCDSTSTLNLTINSVDANVSFNYDSISANELNAQYQWLSCDSGYSEIIGATAKTYQATMNGLYAVVVTKNGCTDTSECIEITSVGLAEGIELSEYRIFPNPTNGKIRIIGPNQSQASVRIFNLQGEILYQSQTIPNEAINLNVASGLYFAEVGSEGYRRTFKLVVE